MSSNQINFKKLKDLFDFSEKAKYQANLNSVFFLF